MYITVFFSFLSFSGETVPKLLILFRWISVVILLLRALRLPGVLGFSSVRHEPCPTTNFLIVYFRWREGVPTSVLGSQPIIWLLSSSPWSGDSLGLLDVTPYPILYPSGYQVQTSVFPFLPGFVTLGIDPHYYGVLTVILWWLATVNSRTGNSRNLISIVSVGHHVTIYIYFWFFKDFFWISKY